MGKLDVAQWLYQRFGHMEHTDESDSVTMVLIAQRNAIQAARWLYKTHNLNGMTNVAVNKYSGSLVIACKLKHLQMAIWINRYLTKFKHGTSKNIGVVLMGNNEHTQQWLQTELGVVNNRQHWSRAMHHTWYHTWQASTVATARSLGRDVLFDVLRRLAA